MIGYKYSEIVLRKEKQEKMDFINSIDISIRKFNGIKEGKMNDFDFEGNDDDEIKQ
ncbi:MAG: hypothetical protein GTO45_17510 [Candidatus Aminicenantes bacterium]|nr:hypothetical protein [Candidatus Aminicenantes bacterium]NIM80547.1 hypothetical protein [Candidatus Aminicenantes bacterium]NIN19928.1 hypothetical protein [Candidatus Aminicenantes bacterium]NIN43776.1 hypothetical protein [Candidatus Aminicenantes bacterium]NIN86554.1 hypothetical protein [Candidatus Aminicenantes bacterium]